MSTTAKKYNTNSQSNFLAFPKNDSRNDFLTSKKIYDGLSTTIRIFYLFFLLVLTAFMLTTRVDSVGQRSYFFVFMISFAVYLLITELLNKNFLYYSRFLRWGIGILLCSTLLYFGRGHHELYLLFLPWSITIAIRTEMDEKHVYVFFLFFITFSIIIPLYLLQSSQTEYFLAMFFLCFIYLISFLTYYSWDRIRKLEKASMFLIDIVEKINSHEEVESVYTYVLTKCKEYLRSDLERVYLYSYSENTFVKSIDIVEGKVISSQVNFDLPHAFVNDVPTDEIPLIIEKISKSKGDIVKDCKKKSELYIPISLPDRFIGIMDFKREKKFNKLDLHVLRIVSQNIASAMGKIEYLKNLNRTIEINNTISKDQKIEKVLKTLLQKSRNLVGGDYGVIVFMTSSKKRLVKFENLHFLKKKKIEENLEENEHSLEERKLEEKLIDLCYVLNNGKKFVKKDLSRLIKRNKFLFKWFFKEKFGSIIAIPMKYEEKVVGELTIGFEHPNAFSQNEVKILEIVASQTSIALQNAYKFETVTNSSIAFNKIERSISEEYSKALEVALEEGINLTEAISGHIRLYNKKTDFLELQACTGEYKELVVKEKPLDYKDPVNKLYLKNKQGTIACEKFLRLKEKIFKQMGKYEEFKKFYMTSKEALVLPFHVDRLSGYLLMHFTSKESAERHKPLLGELKSYVINTLEKSILYKERKERLNLLSEMILKSKTAQNLESLTQWATKHISAKMNTDSCSLFLVNEESARTEEPVFIEKTAHSSNEIPLEFEEKYYPGEGLTGQVYKSSVPVNITVSSKIIKQAKYPEVCKNVHHFLAVPFFDENDKVVGILRVMNKKSPKAIRLSKKLEPRGFSEEDIELLTAMGNVVFSAIYSERKKIELIRAQQMAMLGIMASGLAHEIMQPLQIILTKAQVCERDIKRGKIDTEHIIRDLISIANTTKRIDVIVNHLHILSRDHKENLENININSVINSSLVMFQQQLKSRGIKVEKNFFKDPIWVNGDKIRLEQVFINLVNNARDALEGKRNRKIIISTKEVDQKVQIEFEDNGMGISKKNLPNIFKPLMTTKDIGVGLGLYITKDIVSNHKGTIAVSYSEVDVGTRFLITLPQCLV